MKNILKLFVSVILLSGALVSCETYDKTPDIEYSSVAPLDGRWICFAYNPAEYNASPATATRYELVEIYSSGTVDGAPDKLWLHIGYMLRRGATTIETVSVKVDCNVAGKTFGISGGKTAAAPPMFTTPYYATTTGTKTAAGVYNNLHVYSGYPQNRPTYSKANLNVNITGGVITMNGYQTPTGYSADHIKFTIELTGNADAADNYSYVIEGHRHTGWANDYDETGDSASAHHRFNIAAYVEEYIWRRDGEWPIPAYYAPRNTFHAFF
jgi:hypothetical protein